MGGYLPDDTTQKSRGSGNTQTLIAIDPDVVGREKVVHVPVAVSRGQDRRPPPPAIDRRAEIMAGSPSASSVKGMAQAAPCHLPSSTGIPLVMIALRRIDGSIADVLLPSRVRGCMAVTVGKQLGNQGRLGGHGSFRAQAMLDSLANGRIAGGGR